MQSPFKKLIVKWFNVTKYAAWVNQYGWAVYDAGMDILATHNLGTNSRRYKDLYNLRDIIHTGNLAPNGWSNW
ncbi:19468_t:CDS:2 [Entrophospora sp. SA101]|nr:19468_t:CDS:2 [Entrophospora sp. SA101]